MGANRDNACAAAERKRVKPSFSEAIIVEGKYDKIKLNSILDAYIIETGGFSVFKDTELAQLIKKLASERGLIVLTDNDAAGFKIRNYIKNITAGLRVLHAYVPDIEGKEKRKEKHSKEGKLGVEGIPADVILKALKKAGANPHKELSAAEETAEKSEGDITAAVFYELSLTGADNSAQLRRSLAQSLGLPKRMSAKALMEYLKLAGFSAVELRERLEESTENADKGEQG